jgi:hypothetical protein
MTWHRPRGCAPPSARAAIAGSLARRATAALHATPPLARTALPSLAAVDVNAAAAAVGELEDEDVAARRTGVCADPAWQI